MSFLKKIIFTIKAKLYKRKLKKNLNVTFARHSGTDKKSIYEGDNYIGTNNYVQNCMLGRGSIIARDTTVQNAKMGRFSGFGPETKLIVSKHPSRDYVSTHQSFFSMHPVTEKTYVSKQMFKEESESDADGYQIIVGNDVWIGQGATLMGGITIGDGAIVAAGAVVVKDVEPYSIVGGVPAKILRYRFDREDIEWLLSYRWWDKDEDWLKENADYFKSISLLRSKVENEN